MQKKIKMIAGMLIVLFCILLGCEGKKERGEDLLLLPAGEETSQDVFAENANKLAESEAISELASAEAAKSDKLQNTGTVTTIEYVVHICGAVVSPGVYTFSQDSRVYQAVEAAGGFVEDAAQDYLNQADFLSDGMQLYVPTIKEIEEAGTQEVRPPQSLSEKGQSDTGTLVNINQANEELLCTLPGIGSSKAKGIILYREFNGAFRSIEDIKNVEGIKEGLFQKIKDRITI